MKSHRNWTLGALCWFFLLFNIERMVESINLASFVYFLSFVAAAAMLWSRRARELPFGVTSGVFLLLLIVGKVRLGYAVDLHSLPLTLVEGMAVVLSQFLCLKVAQHTDEFLITSNQLLDVLRACSVSDIRDAEPFLLEEIRRARRHERPLTFVKLSPQQVTPQALRELVRQLEQSLGQEYVIGCISDILQRTTKSHDLAVRIGNQFLLLLPETNAQQAANMTQRLKDSIANTLGIELTTETLEFGLEELTLNGVLDRLRMDPQEDTPSPPNESYQLKRSKPQHAVTVDAAI